MASSNRFRILSWGIALVALNLATATVAEPSNLRVGVSRTVLDIDPAASYLTTSDNVGMAVFAEFPQSNHTSSRFVLYRIHEDGNASQRKDVTGFETQLMWGWGLAEPGFRIYTGPAWHREKILVERSGSRKTRFFNGWGWQLGLGVQQGPITVEFAATWRDPDDYRTENRRPEIKATGIDDQKPKVWLNNMMISYRF